MTMADPDDFQRWLAEGGRSKAYNICKRCGINFKSRALYPCIVKQQRFEDHDFSDTVNTPSGTLPS